MDDLIGLIIIGVIFGVAWLFNKIKESQQAQRSEPPVVKREDLPERTRQMLYGGEVQMAKPKQGQAFQPEERRAAPPAAPPQRHAAPRPLPPATPRRTVVGGRPAPVATPVRQEMPPQVAQAQRAVAAEELSPRELQALRDLQAQPHQHEAGHDLTPHELKILRERQEAGERARPEVDEVSPRQQRALREQQQLAQQRQRLVAQTKRIEQQAVQAESTPKHAAARPARARRFLGNLDDVRRGIVLGEILGPPKALQ